MFDYSKLKGRIAEKNFNQSKLATFLGISKGAMSLKLRQKTFFTSEEINKMATVLNITADEIGIYFFCDSVAKKQQERS